MTYVTGDIPVGTYDPSNLANIGIGHGAIDGGVEYTYLNTQSGHEFSAVTGLTYNFKNTDTDYRKGVDWHLDWAPRGSSRSRCCRRCRLFLQSAHRRQRPARDPWRQQIARRCGRPADRLPVSGR